MPFNGVGVFSRVYQWVNDAALGTFVDATRTDTDSNDIATGLTNCVTRDGQSPWLANLPAGGFKLTGMGNGSAATDSVNYGQVFASPAFVTPTATTSPAFGNRSLLLSTTTWVGAEFAPLASPALTGVPTVPTAAPGTNTTQAASTAFATALAFSAALPAQSLGFLSSTGAVASFTKNLTFGLNEAKAADVASAATPDIWAGNGNTLHITGTTTLTGFAAAPQAGAWRKLYFDGACLLTNGANFNVQGGVNYTTAAGDIVLVYADTTTKFYLLVQKANGGAVAVQNFVLAAQFDKTSDTTLADLPGFVATLVTGQSYKFRVVAQTVSVAGGGGIKFGFSGTATATSFVAGMNIRDNTNLASVVRVTLLTSTLGFSGAQSYVTSIEGVIVCNAGGTFQIQFAQFVSHATVCSVLANSSFTVERIS